jgi:transcriptional regulator with XRE-family HTH domain
MFSKEKFSKRLAELRSVHKVSSQALAEGIGISRPAISRFEHGVDFPHVNTLCALADYFDVSLDYLVGRSDDPARH